MADYAFPHRHLLGIEGLNRLEIETLLELGDRYVELNRSRVKHADVLAGRIHMFIGAINSLLPLIKEGKLTALAAAAGDSLGVDGVRLDVALTSVAGTPLHLVRVGEQVHRVVARRGDARGDVVRRVERRAGGQRGGARAVEAAAEGRIAAGDARARAPRLLLRPKSTTDNGPRGCDIPPGERQGGYLCFKAKADGRWEIQNY